MRNRLLYTSAKKSDKLKIKSESVKFKCKTLSKYVKFLSNFLGFRNWHLTRLLLRWLNNNLICVKQVLVIVIVICIATFIINIFWTFSTSQEAQPAHLKYANNLKNKVLFPSNPEEALPPSPSVLNSFKKCAICSDSDVCSKIGRLIFTYDGNIIDSTLATLFCLGLTNMQSMGMGGGFVMNLYIHKDRTAYSINARERAPYAAKNDTYYSNSRKDDKMFTGPLSITVPGEILGYWELYKRFATMEWKQLLEPTIRLCESGFILSKHMEDALNLSNINKTSTFFRKMFINPKNNEFLRVGSLIRPPENLCKTYRLLANNGGSDFYNGTLAKLILQDLKDVGSVISERDFSSYKTKWTKSIPIKLKTDTVYVTPPPSSGLLVSFILNIISGYNFTSNSRKADSSTRTYHRIIEAFKFAFAKRAELGDPEKYNIRELIKNLTSSKYAEQIRQLIDDRRTFSNQNRYKAKFSATLNSGTSHLSIIAPNGDAVSVTSSINFFFGAGIAGDRTGIIFNSGIDDFSFAGKTNYFNLPASPSNYIEPGKQSVSSMTPIIVCDKNGNVKIAIGAAGGAKIITSVAMALIRLIWFDQNIKEAIDAPRIHHQLQPMVVQYEYGNIKSLIEDLESLHHKTERYANRGSIICALHKNESGIFGAADFRKSGQIIGF